MTRRPDLFIVGAPKCGTTSLYEYLRGHPQVFMSPDKEPRYFAPDMLTGLPDFELRYPQDEERYLRLFAGASDEKRLGEASPHYLYSTQAPRLIHDFQPDARIVISLRNPASMLYSMHGGRVAKGLEDIVDFEAALAAERDRRAGRRIPKGSSPLLVTYRERAYFSEHLPRWFDEFGRARVHVMIFEDFLRDPAGQFRDLLEFLDVDTSYEPASFRAHNEGHQPRSRRLRAVLDSASLRTATRRLLPDRLSDGLRRRVARPLRSLNRAPTRRPGLEPGVRRRLEEEFEGEVSALGELLERDLRALWFTSEKAASAAPSA
jgi:hypothetical protein